jgi:hypothetical protein
MQSETADDHLARKFDKCQEARIHWIATVRRLELERDTSCDAEVLLKNCQERKFSTSPKAVEKSIRRAISLIRSGGSAKDPEDDDTRPDGDNPRDLIDPEIKYFLRQHKELENLTNVKITFFPFSD